MKILVVMVMMLVRIVCMTAAPSPRSQDPGGDAHVLSLSLLWVRGEGGWEGEEGERGEDWPRHPSCIMHYGLTVQRETWGGGVGVKKLHGVVGSMKGRT